MGIIGPFIMRHSLPSHPYLCVGTREPTMHRASERLTDAAGFLGRPLVVLLTGDVLLPHQLEGGQALEVQPVAVAKARPLPFAIGWDPRVAATALFNF